MRKYIVPIALLAGLLIYTLWPYSSHKWDIRFDQEMIDNKRRHLEALKARLAEGPRSSPPNIVLILADDLGKYDISLYGDTGIPTPHIDSIGRQGVSFTEGYSTSAICCPSRAALLTGRDQNRFGFSCHMIDIYLRNRLFYWSTRALVDTDEMTPVHHREVPRSSELWKQGLPPSEICLGELLQSSGYRTAVVGKWHLGYDEIHHPSKRGFDYQYGFIEAFSLYAREDSPDVVEYRHDLFWEKHIWRTGRKGPSAITRNAEVIEENRFLTDAIAEESVRFIREHVAGADADGGAPFFLYASFSAPHTPFQAQRTYYERFSHIADPARRLYCAMVANLDDAVGSILGVLRELGIGQDTLIVFTSDNGGAAYTGGTTNAPLKGGKMTHFEGGLNVPFMMRWEGVIPPGMVFDDPVILTDVFVTAAAASGSPLPEDRAYDGVDLLPYLRGEQAGKPHDVLHWKTMYGSIVRRERWKLILNSRLESVRLYDLEHDKGEAADRADSHPEVVQELTTEIRLWEQRLPPPLWPHLMEIRWQIAGEEEIFPI